MRGIKEVEDFIEASRAVGYETGKESVFKAAFNSGSWTVLFLIKPVNDGTYELPGRCGKARHKKFDRAVKVAIKKALRLEQV